MNVFSLMFIEVRDGVRDDAIIAFKKRLIFEECAQAIPGFIQAKLLASQNELNRIVVVAEWVDGSDFTDWTKHAVRDLQEKDLSHFLAAVPHTHLYDVHSFWPI